MDSLYNEMRRYLRPFHLHRSHDLRSLLRGPIAYAYRSKMTQRGKATRVGGQNITLTSGPVLAHALQKYMLRTLPTLATDVSDNRYTFAVPMRFASDAAAAAPFSSSVGI